MLSRQFGDLRLGFFQRLAAAVQQFIRVADRGNRFPAEAAAFQAFDIDAEWRRMVALGNHERRNVLRHAGAAANHNM